MSWNEFDGEEKKARAEYKSYAKKKAKMLYHDDEVVLKDGDQLLTEEMKKYALKNYGAIESYRFNPDDKKKHVCCCKEFVNIQRPHDYETKFKLKTKNAPNQSPKLILGRDDGKIEKFYQKKKLFFSRLNDDINKWQLFGRNVVIYDLVQLLVDSSLSQRGQVIRLHGRETSGSYNLGLFTINYCRDRGFFPDGALEINAENFTTNKQLVQEIGDNFELISFMDVIKKLSNMKIVIMINRCSKLIKNDYESFCNFLIELTEKTQYLKVIYIPGTQTEMNYDRPHILNQKQIAFEIDILSPEDSIDMFYDLNKEKNIRNKLNTEKKDLEDLEMFKKPDEKIWFTPKKILEMSNMFVMDFKYTCSNDHELELINHSIKDGYQICKTCQKPITAAQIKKNYYNCSIDKSNFHKECAEKKKNLDDINKIMMSKQGFQFCERIFDKLVGRKKNQQSDRDSVAKNENILRIIYWISYSKSGLYYQDIKDQMEIKDWEDFIQPQAMDDDGKEKENILSEQQIEYILVQEQCKTHKYKFQVSNIFQRFLKEKKEEEDIYLKDYLNMLRIRSRSIVKNMQKKLQTDFNPVILSAAIDHDLWATTFDKEDQETEKLQVEEDNCKLYFKNHLENFREVNQLVKTALDRHPWSGFIELLINVPSIFIIQEEFDEAFQFIDTSIKFLEHGYKQKDEYNLLILMRASLSNFLDQEKTIALEVDFCQFNRGSQVGKDRQKTKMQGEVLVMKALQTSVEVSNELLKNFDDLDITEIDNLPMKQLSLGGKQKSLQLSKQQSVSQEFIDQPEKQFNKIFDNLEKCNKELYFDKKSVSWSKVWLIETNILVQYFTFLEHQSEVQKEDTFRLQEIETLTKMIKEKLNKIISKLEDIKLAIKCFEDKELHNHGHRLMLNVAMIKLICDQTDADTFKYLGQCMRSQDSQIRDQAMIYLKDKKYKDYSNLIILANSFPIDEEGDQPVQQTCEEKFQNDLIEKLQPTNKSTYVQFEVMNQSFFNDLNEMTKKINILVIQPHRFQIGVDNQTCMIVEKDNCLPEKLTPDDLRKKLPKQLEVNVVILQFPNCEDFAKVFQELGAKTVIYFNHQFEHQGRFQSKLKINLDLIKQYHLVATAMQQYVITFIQQIQTEKPIEEVYKLAQQELSLNMSPKVLEPQSEKDDGLKEIRATLQLGEILDNRIISNQQNDFQASNQTYLFYKNSYKMFSNIVKTLQDGDKDISIQGQDGIDKLGLAKQVAAYFKTRNMFTKGIFLIDPYDRENTLKIRKKILSLIPKKKGQDLQEVEESATNGVLIIGNFQNQFSSQKDSSEYINYLSMKKNIKNLKVIFIQNSYVESFQYETKILNMDSRNLNESIMLVQNLHNNYGGTEEFQISKEFHEILKLVNGHVMAIKLIYHLVRRLTVDERAKLLGKIEFKGLNLFTQPTEKIEVMQDINQKIHLEIYDIMKKNLSKVVEEESEVSKVQADDEDSDGSYDLDINEDDLDEKQPVEVGKQFSSMSKFKSEAVKEKIELTKPKSNEQVFHKSSTMRSTNNKTESLQTGAVQDENIIKNNGQIQIEAYNIHNQRLKVWFTIQLQTNKINFYVLEPIYHEHQENGKTKLCLTRKETKRATTLQNEKKREQLKRFSLEKQEPETKYKKSEDGIQAMDRITFYCNIAKVDQNVFTEAYESESDEEDKK